MAEVKGSGNARRNTTVTTAIIAIKSGLLVTLLRQRVFYKEIPALVTFKTHDNLVIYLTLKKKVLGTQQKTTERIDPCLQRLLVIYLTRTILLISCYETEIVSIRRPN